MDWALAIVALTLLGVATISRRLYGTPITPAMVFVAVGLLAGPKVLGEIDLESSSATHANERGSASAHFASSVVLPYPAGATTVAKGKVDVQSRSIASAFATVPGRADGAASLAPTRSKGTSVTAIAGILGGHVTLGRSWPLYFIPTG